MKPIIFILFPFSLVALLLSEEPIAVLVQSTEQVSRCVSDDCDSIAHGSLLYKNDIIITSKDSFTKIRFLDNGLDIMLYDKSKLIISGNRIEQGFRESIMVSYGNAFVSTNGSNNTIETPHLSLSNQIPSSIYLTIDNNNNEKVYIISGEVESKKNSFLGQDTSRGSGSLISFNKAVSFSNSPRRVVKSIINNQISHNAYIPAEILKEYNLISSVGKLQTESGTITIPLRSASGEFKNLIIEYYVNEK